MWICREDPWSVPFTFEELVCDFLVQCWGTTVGIFACWNLHFHFSSWDKDADTDRLIDAGKSEVICILIVVEFHLLLLKSTSKFGGAPLLCWLNSGWCLLTKARFPGNVVNSIINPSKNHNFYGCDFQPSPNGRFMDARVSHANFLGPEHQLRHPPSRTLQARPGRAPWAAGCLGVHAGTVANQKVSRTSLSKVNDDKWNIIPKWLDISFPKMGSLGFETWEGKNLVGLCDQYKAVRAVKVCKQEQTPKCHVAVPFVAMPFLQIR